MHHRRSSRILTLVAVALAISGCAQKKAPGGGAVSPGGGPFSPLPPCQNCMQIDVGGYVMTDANNNPVAAIWVDKKTLNEYWAKGTLTAATPMPWKISHTPDDSCKDWFRRTCTLLSSSSKPTWYQATDTQNQGFSCSTKPGPEGKTSSFLPTGSYQVTMGGSSAWIFIDKQVEYWAMDDLISADRESTIKSDIPFSGAAELVSYVCAHDSHAKLWFTPTYNLSPDYCAAPPPDCKD